MGKPMARTLDAEGVCIRCGAPDVHCQCPDQAADYICRGCRAEVAEGDVVQGGHLVEMPTGWTLETGLDFDHCGPVERSAQMSPDPVRDAEYVAALEAVVAAADGYIYGPSDRRQETYTEYRRVRALLDPPRWRPQRIALTDGSKEES